MAKPGTTPPIASPQRDAELCEFLDGCLDSRIIEKALQALDDEEVFTLDDLIIFQRLPHFGLAFKPLTAEKLTRALESRLGPGATESEESPADRGPTDTHTAMVMVDASSTGDGTEDIDEPAWLAEAGNRLSSSFSQGETTVPSPPASSTASSATAFTAPAAPAPDPLAVHAAAHLNAPPVAAPISAPIPTASTPPPRASRDDGDDAAAVARAALAAVALSLASSEESRATTNATMQTLTRALSDLTFERTSPGDGGVPAMVHGPGSVNASGWPGAMPPAYAPATPPSQHAAQPPTTPTAHHPARPAVSPGVSASAVLDQLRAASTPEEQLYILQQAWGGQLTIDEATSILTKLGAARSIAAVAQTVGTSTAFGAAAAASANAPSSACVSGGVALDFLGSPSAAPPPAFGAAADDSDADAAAADAAATNRAATNGAENSVARSLFPPSDDLGGGSGDAGDARVLADGADEPEWLAEARADLDTPDADLDTPRWLQHANSHWLQHANNQLNALAEDSVAPPPHARRPTSDTHRSRSERRGGSADRRGTSAEAGRLTRRRELNARLLMHGAPPAASQSHVVTTHHHHYTPTQSPQKPQKPRHSRDCAALPPVSPLIYGPSYTPLIEGLESQFSWLAGQERQGSSSSGGSSSAAQRSWSFSRAESSLHRQARQARPPRSAPSSSAEPLAGGSLDTMTAFFDPRSESLDTLTVMDDDSDAPATRDAVADEKRDEARSGRREAAPASQRRRHSRSRDSHDGDDADATLPPAALDVWGNEVVPPAAATLLEVEPPLRQRAPSPPAAPAVKGWVSRAWKLGVGAFGFGGGSGDVPAAGDEPIGDEPIGAGAPISTAAGRSKSFDVNHGRRRHAATPPPETAQLLTAPPQSPYMDAEETLWLDEATARMQREALVASARRLLWV